MQNMYCSEHFEKRKEEDRKKINTLLISHIWLKNFVVCNLKLFGTSWYTIYCIRLQTWLYVCIYVGMCRPIGLSFCAVLVWKWVYTLPILVWNRVWFSRELRSVWTYLSFQFQMSKKEREICEFEMDLKNFFVCTLI